MKIENKIRKRIKTITITTGKYPEEIELSPEEYYELKAYVIKSTTMFIGILDKFEGVKIKCKN